MANRLNTRSRQSFRGSRNRGSFGGPRGRGRGGSSAVRSDTTPKQDDEGTRLAERFEQVQTYDEIDEKLGFARIQEGPKKEGWLVNMHPVECAFSVRHTRMRVGLRVLWIQALLSIFLLYRGVLTEHCIRRS
jgi:hypothetical protein